VPCALCQHSLREALAACVAVIEAPIALASHAFEYPPAETLACVPVALASVGALDPWMRIVISDEKLASPCVALGAGAQGAVHARPHVLSVLVLEAVAALAISIARPMPAAAILAHGGAVSAPVEAHAVLLRYVGGRAGGVAGGLR